jgi:iron complex outermembrane receptor protein
MNVLSSYFLSEFRVTPRLRVIGGFRLEIFDTNSNLSLNHEIAATYRVNKANLLRIVQSRATRSPFMYDSRLGVHFLTAAYEPFEGNAAPVFAFADIRILARRDQNYMANDAVELGWRRKINSRLDFDVEAFVSRMDQLVVSKAYSTARLEFQMTPYQSIDTLNRADISADVYFENQDAWATQAGVTLALTGRMAENLEFKVHGTIQNTGLGGDVDQGFQLIGNSTEYDSTRNVLYIISQATADPVQWNAEATPQFFGGISLNWTASSRLMLHVNAYWASKQFHYAVPDYSINLANTGIYEQATTTIPAFTNVNFKSTWKAFETASLFITGHNLLGHHREYPFTDPIGRSFYVGVEW